MADIQDPELLFHALRNGVALSNLIPAFERVAPETMSAQTFTLETVLSAKGYSVFQSLDSATIYENIEAFITYCKETLICGGLGLYAIESQVFAKHDFS